MSRPRVLRAREPRDLIALVPYRLGFHPASSVVLLGLEVTARGATEVGLVIRVDTADLAHPDHGALFADSLAERLARNRANDVFVVIYTPAAWGSPAREDLTRVHRVLDDALAPMPSRAPWVVGPDGWGHLRCEGCCPPTGRSPDELVGTQLGAALVLEGIAAAPSRAELAPVRVAPGPARSGAARAADDERARRRRAAAACGGAPLVRGAAFGVPGARASRDQRPLERWREDGARLWHRTVRPPAAGPVPPSDLGRLLAFLEDRFLRDAVIAATIDGAGRSPVAYLSIAAIWHAHDAAGPPREDAFEPAMALVSAVTAHAAEGGGAAALGVLAFLAWWCGEGARADVVARRALAEEPGHHLAELVVEAAATGMPPPWYRPRR